MSREAFLVAEIERLEMQIRGHSLDELLHGHINRYQPAQNIPRHRAQQHYWRVLTPPQITADQNNYNPPGLVGIDILRISTDVARTITGLYSAPFREGLPLLVMNVGSDIAVLADESVLSDAVNRFALSSNLNLYPDQLVLLHHDVISIRWRANLLSHNDLYHTQSQAALHLYAQQNGTLLHSNPGVAYTDYIPDTGSGRVRMRWDFGQTPHNSAKLIVIAGGNEAGSGKGMRFVINGTAVETTWNGSGADTRDSGWVGFTAPAGTGFIGLEVKGSSATEDMELHHCVLFLRRV